MLACSHKVSDISAVERGGTAPSEHSRPIELYLLPDDEQVTENVKSATVQR